MTYIKIKDIKEPHIAIMAENPYDRFSLYGNAQMVGWLMIEEKDGLAYHPMYSHEEINDGFVYNPTIKIYRENAQESILDEASLPEYGGKDKELAVIFELNSITEFKKLTQQAEINIEQMYAKKLNSTGFHDYALLTKQYSHPIKGSGAVVLDMTVELHDEEKSLVVLDSYKEDVQYLVFEEMEGEHDGGTCYPYTLEGLKQALQHYHTLCKNFSFYRKTDLKKNLLNCTEVSSGIYLVNYSDDYRTSVGKYISTDDVIRALNYNDTNVVIENRHGEVLHEKIAKPKGIHA